MTGTDLLTCSLCSASLDQQESDTYDHVFRSCTHSLFQQCRLSSAASLDNYAPDTDLERLLISQVLQPRTVCRGSPYLLRPLEHTPDQLLIRGGYSRRLQSSSLSFVKEENMQRV